jgi:hypothetical protein
MLGLSLTGLLVRLLLLLLAIMSSLKFDQR